MSIEAILFHAGGSDPQLLAGAGVSERFRHKCRGALVLTIAGLNLAGFSYAFIVALLPPISVEPRNSWLTVTVCLLLGACWAMVVWNLYRFLVSATGPGKGAVPANLPEWAPLLMSSTFAMILAICVSVPVGIALLRTQLANELSATQRALISELNAHEEMKLQTGIDERYAAHARTLIELERVSRRIGALNRESGANARLAASPSATRMRADSNRLRAELRSARENLVRKLGDEKRDIERVRDELRVQKDANRQRILRADTLVNEAERAFQQQFPLMIGLAVFFILVHVAPLVLKHFSNPGVYDRLVDLQNKLVLQKHGITPDASLIPLVGRNRWMDHFAVPERILQAVVVQWQHR